MAAAQLNAGNLDAVRLSRLRLSIEQQVDVMSRVIGDLLDKARADHGKIRLQCVDVDLAELITRAIGACRPSAALRAQHLALHLPAEPGLHVHGDPIRLLQMIGNLLSNASKYTPRGGKISMSVMLCADWIQMTVSDNGIGIPTDSLGKIFDPFVQTDLALRCDGSGLGIGLSLVRELAEAHGGRVAARSAGPGLGSAFTVMLPVPGARKHGFPKHAIHLDPA
ncbi:HAMP domain-containing sensor histidine kinase [Paucibacter sp. O1-1]|nr:HAMP domain-containing histidine kinase [Paucibacter sp. O1-1]MDA3830906.1 HAMP domain-containing sensor histidine kinase [Paucibacter sp. O1-1]